MGRGRAKAKQVKVARQLKYSGGGMDLDQLRAEFGVGTDRRDADDHTAYADLASRYSDDEDEEDDYPAGGEDDDLADDDLDDFDEDDLDDLDEDDLDDLDEDDLDEEDAAGPAHQYSQAEDGADAR